MPDAQMVDSSDSGSDTRLDPDAFNRNLLEAVEAVRADPLNEWVMGNLARMLTPMASRFAQKISLTREDREDACSIILTHLCESAKPPEHRRLNRRGKPVAGYDDQSNGRPWAFFYNAAKNKAHDILKSRCRQWKREGAVIQEIIDYGTVVTLPNNHIQEPEDAVLNRSKAL